MKSYLGHIFHGRVGPHCFTYNLMILGPPLIRIFQYLWAPVGRINGIHDLLMSQTFIEMFSPIFYYLANGC